MSHRFDCLCSRPSLVDDKLTLLLLGEGCQHVVPTALPVIGVETVTDVYSSYSLSLSLAARLFTPSPLW